MPKILLADDHSIVREGLKQILADGFPRATFGECSNAQTTIERLMERPWDVLVLDIFMPGRSGLEVLHEVRQHHPHLPVIVLSSAPEEQLAMRVLKAGASGYLSKQAAPEHLVEAVQKVMAGGKYVSAAMAERLASELSRPSEPATEALSDREFEVLHLLVTGKTLKEIADELALSPKTISTFHTRIWEKLGVRNDVEMVRYVFEHNMIRPADGACPPAIPPRP